VIRPLAVLPEVRAFLPAAALDVHMKIRGERECRDCGTRWSYYETGSVTCPSCGSLRSVGLDDRKEHTASPVDLDLTAARNALEGGQHLTEAVAEAKERCREYVRATGFVDAGDLRPLDDTYLAALELVHAADLVGRSFAPTEAEELYFLSLLRGADFGERPDTNEVPTSMREARGLAAADGVEAYRSDLRAFLDSDPERPVTEVLSALDDHVRRVKALGGDVEPREADLLVAVVRDLAHYLTERDESALATARDRLDRLP
jgi:hypothetical protein